MLEKIRQPYGKEWVISRQKYSPAGAERKGDAEMTEKALLTIKEVIIGLEDFLVSYGTSRQSEHYAHRKIVGNRNKFIRGVIFKPTI